MVACDLAQILAERSGTYSGCTTVDGGGQLVSLIMIHGTALLNVNGLLDFTLCQSLHIDVTQNTECPVANQTHPSGFVQVQIFLEPNNNGARWLNGCMPNPLCYRFKVWAFQFSPRCSSSLSCINEYLAIDAGLPMGEV